MDGSFGNDVSVEAVAKVDGVDVIAGHGVSVCRNFEGARRWQPAPRGKAC